MTDATQLPLQPVARLTPPQWAQDEELGQLLDLLAAKGEDTRFVGGCLRDHLLGRRIGDIDVGTPLAPEEVIRRLDDAGIGHVPTGLAHGTVTALLRQEGGERRPIEITTLRIDVETFGRHAKVAFTDDWQADAARRDLTFNALSMSRDGALYDYFGGREDLAEGRLRFIGDARARISEDYLRLLRFFRFQAHYGRVAPEPETLAVIRELAPQLARLSGERVRVELLKLLAAPDPLPVVEIILTDGIFAAILETRNDAEMLERILPLDGPEQGGPRPILRLACLLAPNSAEAATLRLKLSNRERRELTLLLSDRTPALDGAGRGLRRRLIRDYGAESYGDLLRLAVAKGELRETTLAQYLGEATELSKLVFPIQGRDLRELGIKTGPEIGRLLAQLEDWWDSEDCRPDRGTCLTRLSKLLTNSTKAR